MDTSARVACCMICLLASAMRDCEHCAFKAGLAVKAQQGSGAKQNTVFTQEELKP